MFDGLHAKHWSETPTLTLARLDRSLKWLSVLAVLGCALLLPAFSFGRDQGIYATVGSGILDGKVPYRDLWDFKPPGIFFIFAAAQAIFGHNMAAPRILEALGLLAMAFAMSRLSERWYGSSTPGWMGGAIAAIVHVELDFWHTGQPESFGGIFTIVALWLATDEEQPRFRPLFWGIAGALLGYSALLKPPLGGVGLVLFAYLLRQRQRIGQRSLITGLAALAFGAALPFLVGAAWFWARGGWSAMVWTLRDFVPGYTALGWRGDHRAIEMFYFAVVEALTRFSALIAVGVVAALMMRPTTERELAGNFLLLGCALVQTTGIALQAKFFQYHYGATTPLLSLLAGLGWHKLWTYAWLRRPFGLVVAGVSVLAALQMRKPVRDVPGTVPERSLARLSYLLHRPNFDTRDKLDAALHRAADYDLAADRRVSAWILEHTQADESVLIWGFEPVVYWMTGRRPATRFIYDVPQRSQWQTESSQRMFMDEVTQLDPAVIIVQHNDVFPGVTGYATDSAADLRRFAKLDDLVNDRYSFVATIEDFDFYRRLDALPVNARATSPHVPELSPLTGQ
jgi:hypothetical protein